VPRSGNGDVRRHAWDGGCDFGRRVARVARQRRSVLRNSNKLALRLTPCEVFARVAHVGQEVAQFEVELAQRLSEAGSPVVSLEPRVDPRV